MENSVKIILSMNKNTIKNEPNTTFSGSGLPGGIMIRKSTHEQDAAPLRHNHLKVVRYQIYEQRFSLHKQL